MTNQRGFTFIELLVVVSIIGLLAAIAVPQFSAYRTRAYRAEGYQLADAARKNIVEFYDYTGRLPLDNAESGLAKPIAIRGKYVESVTVENGQITVVYLPQYQQRRYSAPMILVPIINQANPTGPLVWQEEKG
ncbi:MAG: prepilin-type cleavage/methylation domain-containing protein [Candidatus Zixiibacteriota bacterium]|nr:MAG: prepilin-type cleavage/methylation domain-containing protein [candidate division Zixibacteria bacterium]